LASAGGSFFGFHVFFSNDGIDRAFGFAQRAIDALFWVDNEVVGAFVEAIHWAHFNTIGVFTSDAVFGNDKSHGAVLYGFGLLYADISKNDAQG